MAILIADDYVNFKNRQKPDWIIHLVMCGVCGSCGEIDESPVHPFLCDCHTHGLDNYGHDELQIVLNIEPELIGYILNVVGDMVRHGAKLEHGDFIRNVIQAYDIKVMKTKDIQGNDIFRLVLPDISGNFPMDIGCREPYCLQDTSTKSIYG